MMKKFRQAKAMRELWQPVEITVPGGRSLEDLIAAGGYAKVDPDISEEHFPSPENASDVRRMIYFFRFDHRRFNQILKRFVTLSYIVGRMRRDITRGYVPMGIRELLAVGEKFKSLCPLVALGDVWEYSFSNIIMTPLGKPKDVPTTVYAVPCIFEAGGSRELGLRRFFVAPEAQKWETDWRFGAIDNSGR